MTTQPEQILEDNLVGQLEKLGYNRVAMPMKKSYQTADFFETDSLLYFTFGYKAQYA